MKDLKDRRIMVVDDDHSILDLFDAILSGFKLPYELYSDPLKALNSFSVSPDRYFIAFLDVIMPGLSGTELAKALQQDTIHPAVVFLNALDEHTDPYNVQKQYELGSRIAKPFNTTLLPDMLCYHIINALKINQAREIMEHLKTFQDHVPFKVLDQVEGFLLATNDAPYTQKPHKVASLLGIKTFNGDK
ncbi:hypothetical protein BOW53_09335 [Solemya pervernicosa gill symbiont]|uniref:Response regulatory domain-containing protein n=2 Tax=Gammaproteobacteria incertae sedis TaxID=118884 RepID=A0A1T2L4J2_9GAMM|nr:response regulator [Candidatus Reidiella endopervernicosa]OOZ40028.1 hypothetical protein BOW53_09335 [Solemya pervernicosa gill symbiont]QKQ25311.1 response regulator [Candidatus Reidiella endopervernicosa]